MNAKGCREPIKVKLFDEEIDSVKSSEYSLSLIDAVGDGTEEVKRRLEMTPQNC